MGMVYDFIRRHFGGETEVSKLMIKLKKDADVRWKTAEALGKIGESAVPALVDALKDEDSDVRWCAAGALKKIGEPAVPALVDALKDRGYEVRWETSEVLGEIGNAQAIPAFIELLRNKNYDVRLNAAWALGKIAEKNPEDTGLVMAVPPLIKLLKKDKNFEVRKYATVALGEIKDARAVPALVDVLRDEDSDVQENADWALGSIIHSLTDIRLREMEGVLRKALGKAEGREEKKNLLDLLDKINERRNAILEPEVKKLRLPLKTKRRKPKRKMWSAVR